MNNQPIKCTSNGYEKEPFYLIQVNENDKRYVISLNDTFRIRIVLSGFINKSETIVDVKIKSFEDVFNPIVYSGKQDKTKIHALLTEFEEVIFHNGYHDLIIRNPDSGDCLTFDEHGLIYIDTDEDYSEVLRNLGAEHKPNERLIHQRFHWHHSTEDGNEKLNAFINALGLVKEEIN
ncbi:MAG TPA: hypothetical protein VIT44_10200 [Cyclobacteriaceae bacterium]